MSRTRLLTPILVSVLALGPACAGTKPPVAKPVPPPPTSTAPSAPTSSPPARPPEPPPPIPEPPPVAGVDTITSDPLAMKTPDEINKESPLKPIFFALDSDQLDEAAQQALADNTQILKKYSTWAITIEGHSDERGTAEYNLALGERRALSAKTYLLSLGIPADRVRTVSYGKEFPFDPGHDDAAWLKNRRAHFVVTGK